MIDQNTMTIVSFGLLSPDLRIGWFVRHPI